MMLSERASARSSGSKMQLTPEKAAPGKERPSMTNDLPPYAVQKLPTPPSGSREPSAPSPTGLVRMTVCAAAPRHESCPQPQSTSTLSASPSQCALQNFSFSGGMQLQAGLAHVL